MIVERVLTGLHRRWKVPTRHDGLVADLPPDHADLDGEWSRMITPEAPSESWDDLAVPANEVGEWKAIGFGPFQAALAHGDGFTPLIASHHVYQHQFARTTAAWRRRGVSPSEAIRWHRAGFAATEAARCQAAGVSLEAARFSRYRPDKV